LSPRVDAATLVVSELVTNAVRHAGTPVSVRVRLLGSRVRLEVGDGDPRLPQPATGTGESGRGLRLVTAVARAWGARPTSHGKVVWAEL
jgi:two-component sensor histidine kinase